MFSSPIDPSIEIRCMSMTQPWASLIQVAATHPQLGKNVETRDKRWLHYRYRGLVVIQAAKTITSDGYDWLRSDLEDPVSHLKTALAAIGINSINDIQKLPRGCAICVANLTEILPTSPSAIQLPFDSQKRTIPGWETAERDFGDYSDNRSMLFLDEIKVLNNPVPLIGRLSLFRLNNQQKEEIIRELAA